MRVHYFAPIATREYCRLTGFNFPVAAAANKVMRVCSAIQATGQPVTVVAAPIVTEFRTAKRIPGFELRESGLDVVFLSTLTVRFINRIFSFLSFLVYAAARVRSGDRVILYNFFPEYIGAALFLRLFRLPATLDIEDAPRRDETGIRGLTNRLSYLVLRVLCSRRAIVAARSIAEELNLKDVHVVYGTMPHRDVASRPRFNGQRIRILYGGAIQQETGVNLLCETLRELAGSEHAGRLEFVITGFGDLDPLRKVAADLGSSVSIAIHENLSADEYQDQLDSCDVGLCLKLPSTHIGRTTFPSKTLEIAASGLLLMSTRASDVPVIFGNDRALLIDGESKAALLSALARLAGAQDELRILSKNGLTFVRANFNPEVVATKLLEFLLEVPRKQR